MSTAQKVMAKLRELTPEQQAEVLRLVEALSNSSGAASKPRRNPVGLLSDLNLDISAEEIDEARREMWGNFPREDIA
ncbi:MAG TPA: hypothetical protein PKC49_03210 [Phycisphaerae bacterium]|nr:hypothetical protein [Phycisphaerae bacterium]